MKKSLNVRIYSTGYPQGRCLQLMQQLHKSTALSKSDCLSLAQRLFDAQFSDGNPAEIEVLNQNAADELESFCAAVGITIERILLT